MRAALLLISLLFSVAAVSADDVLWQPKAAKVPASVLAAEQRLKQSPNNLDYAAALVDEYLTVVRRTASHEVLTMAQQVVASHANKPIEQQPVTWLIAKADLLQYQHLFKEATTVLQEVTDQHPGHLQASLMLARIALAQGKSNDAQSYCADLFGKHELGIVSTCLLEVKGRAETPLLAYQKLKSLQERQQHISPTVTSWRLQILASQALALGRYKEARDWLNKLPRARTIVEQKMLLDSYLFDRQARVPTELIAHCEKAVVDSLAVRYAYAEKYANNQGCWLDYAAQRMRLRVLRNDKLHSADIAYYFTYVEQQPDAALKWAKINYSIAKEPFDKQLLTVAQQLHDNEENHD